MLVYCTQIKFDQNQVDLEQLISVVGRWIGTKSKSFVSSEDLKSGIQRRLSDGSTLKSVSVLGTKFPRFSAISFAHPDSAVSGRQWVTEVGFRQTTIESLIECSILLSTSEVSARVSAPVQVTRPNVLTDLVQKCIPISGTPGVRELRLDEESSKAFLAAIEDERRTAPFVIVSPKRDGSYPVLPSRLCSLLIGLADVVVIPMGANTFEIANTLGSRYASWLGAITIVFSPRELRGSMFIDSMRFLPDELDIITEQGGSPDFEILSVITHRLNLPNSWRHISVESVSRELFRAQLTTKLQQASNSTDSQEYIALLEEADRELRAKDTQIETLIRDIDRQQAEIWQSEAETDSLKAALNGREGRRGGVATGLEALSSLRSSVSGLVLGEPTVVQSLELLSQLFPERIVVLESALSSAESSVSFKFSQEALTLLWTLITDYWGCLDSSQSDNEARKCFGKNDYSAKEAQTLSKDGERRRTFSYKGEGIFMPRHLKIGVKDSIAETLRIHFHWDACEKKIVIGHCGKHIDF